ncbi:carbon-nitrogen hydrolase family protein [Labilibaculum filiforme]|uniref:Carbon-nitrogen hydrolase family protein n=1 Tax=Labilibaculum filiforme TaxID=1940526 RepID=A0A2N3I295_9BACT|nr:carbon-nitrogen hydrolase family protein [Labilibaculum filiforme]PKQ64373.1 carbon-nitrogen hydrolase family protein [Labilibaculum filiforme]
MKIGIVQLEPAKGNIERNIEIHIDWIKKGINHHTALIVFPELSLTGYEPELASSLATNQNDKRLDCFQKLSDENNIAIGVGLPTRNLDELNISMIIFQPLKDRITYSKQYLYPTEVSIFTARFNPIVLECETEIVAPAICYELSNKEHYEFAAENNATVYMASVLNSVNGVDSDLKKLSDIARNYKMVTFMANFIGESGGYKCAGKSTIWNDNGEMIKQLGDKEEGLIIYDTKTREVLTTTSRVDR